ncbi:MAG: glycosyltransferase family 2 protein [Thermoleophilaceae bacterium]|nr:glycosyltransferase family 2 protein [Thermoleophilaceae bacterium]
MTALGRDEPDLLTAAAISVLEVSDSIGSRVEWVIATDGLERQSISNHLAKLRITNHASIDVVAAADRGESVGPGRARNIALGRLKSSWMLTLDGDDRLVGRGVAALLSAVQSNRQAMWAAGRCPHTDEHLQVTWPGPDDPFEPGPVRPGDFWDFKLRTGNLPFLCTATIARTTAVRQVGGWPEIAWGRAEDTALWAVLTSKWSGIWVPEIVYLYRRHAASLTRQEGFRQADEHLTEISTMVVNGRTQDSPH